MHCFYCEEGQPFQFYCDFRFGKHKQCQSCNSPMCQKSYDECKKNPCQECGKVSCKRCYIEEFLTKDPICWKCQKYLCVPCRNIYEKKNISTQAHPSPKETYPFCS